MKHHNVEVHEAKMILQYRTSWMIVSMDKYWKGRYYSNIDHWIISQRTISKRTPGNNQVQCTDRSNLIGPILIFMLKKCKIEKNRGILTCNEMTVLVIGKEGQYKVHPLKYHSNKISVIKKV